MSMWLSFASLLSDPVPASSTEADPANYGSQASLTTGSGQVWPVGGTHRRLEDRRKGEEESPLPLSLA